MIVSLLQLDDTDVDTLSRVGGGQSVGNDSGGELNVLHLLRNFNGEQLT